MVLVVPAVVRIIPESVLPRPARAVFAVTHTRRPGCLLQLELTAPPARDIQDLGRLLRPRDHRRRKPMKVDWARRLKRSLCGDDARLGIRGKRKAQGQIVVLVRVAERQRAFVARLTFKTELGEKRRAVAVAQDQPELA